MNIKHIKAVFAALPDVISDADAESLRAFVETEFARPNEHIEGERPYWNEKFINELALARACSVNKRKARKAQKWGETFLSS